MASEPNQRAFAEAVASGLRNVAKGGIMPKILGSKSGGNYIAPNAQARAFVAKSVASGAITMVGVKNAGVFRKMGKAMKATKTRRTNKKMLFGRIGVH
jgi:hypothetical protein